MPKLPSIFRETIYNSTYELEGSVDKVITKLQEIKKKYEGRRVTILVEPYGLGVDNDLTINIIVEEIKKNSCNQS